MNCIFCSVQIKQFTISPTRGKTSLYNYYYFFLLHIFDLTMLPSIWIEIKFSISQEAPRLCVLLCLFFSHPLWKITFWCVSFSVLKTANYVSVKSEPYIWVLEAVTTHSQISMIRFIMQLHLDNVALTFTTVCWFYKWFYSWMTLKCKIQNRYKWHWSCVAEHISDFRIHILNVTLLLTKEKITLLFK